MTFIMTWHMIDISVSRTALYHREIFSSVERMFTVYHHVDQHRLSDLGFPVGLSVHIEVTEAGTLEHADLAVEWFYPMNVVVVFL